MSIILIGLDNPQSDDPRHALYPHPPGCAGNRLWKMTGLSERDYLRLDRHNLSPISPAPGIRKLREFWDEEIRHTMWDDRRVIGLGARVRDVLLSSEVPPFTWHTCKFWTWEIPTAWMPHPSGRNRYWNNPANAERARAFLREALVHG